jgi:hypothetical protein
MTVLCAAHSLGQAGLRAINLHISVSFGTATLGLPEPEHGGTVLF